MGKTSEFVLIKQGVTQGCPFVAYTVFGLLYIDGLLCEIEKCPELGVKFPENTLSGLMFANDFAGVAETGSALQKLILYIIIANVGVLKPM